MFENINLVQKMMLALVAVIIICLGYGIGLEAKVLLKEKKYINFRQLFSEFFIPKTKQFTVIFGLISLFNLSAAKSKIVQPGPSVGAWILGILFLIFFALNFIYKFVQKENIWKHLKGILWENREIIIFLFLSGCVRMILFSDLYVQRWDAGEYYYRLGTACETFDFTWKSIWENFRLCNHSSIGFAMLLAIGEFQNPRRVTGVLSVILVMTLIALYMIYEMLQKYWMKFDKKQALVGTILISVAPLFLGTFGYVNVDYVLAIVFIYMLYAEFKKQYILLAFWGIIVTQTKETGVFVIAGYYMAHFIVMIFNTRGSLRKKANDILRNRITWSTMIIVACYARYVYKLRAFTAWTQSSGTSSKVLWSNTGNNCFGIQIPYIWVKIKQFFILNFSWIFVVICLIAIAWAVNKKMKLSVKNMTGVYGGVIGFSIFSCIYVTSEIARYNILPTIVFILASYCISEQILSRNMQKKNTMVIWGSIIVLLVIQNFIPIDVVSNIFFKTVDTGKSKMLFTTDASDYYGDYLVNNYQYTWLEKAYDEMMQNVQYDSEMLIILPEEELPGSHIHGNYEAYSIFWDKQLKRRVMYQNDNTEKLNLEFLGYVQSAPLDELPERALLFFIPYYKLNQSEVLEELNQKYTVVEENTTTGRGGIINYYILQKTTEESNDGKLEK